MIVIVPCGGLGNLLFQHHAAWAHAKEQGQDLAALGWYPDTHIFRKKFGDYSLFKHVKILGDGSSPYPEQWPGSPSQIEYIKYLSKEKVIWSEGSHSYLPISRDARILSGYFQSWKYFDKYRTELRDLLRLNEKVIWDEQKARFKGGVCVHVRRGDYLQYQHIHPICTNEYYSSAMKLFPNNKFLLFCENPDDVSDMAGPHAEVVVEPDPLKTLFLMSLCEHFIIANSTLSLMAYYMRETEDARLIAPKNWFGPSVKGFNMSDLIKCATLL
jgi:hypothetical protein